MSFELANVGAIYAQDPKLKKEDVDALFNWLITQPHLPDLTELQVILFLHSCYYQLDAAKTSIETYFTVKASSCFQNPTEEVIRGTLATTFTGILPKRTADGDAIFLMKLMDPRPEKFIMLDQLNLAIMAVTLYFHQFGPSNGLIMIFDTKGASFGHLPKINVSAIRQFSYFMEEAAPVRRKGIHHVNVVPITEYFVAFSKPFMKKEIYNMLRFHTRSIETLYEYIPKECLPQDYGGDLPALQYLQEENLNNLIHHSNFFKWHESQKVDESKKTDKNETEKGIMNSIRGFFIRQ